MADEEGVLTNLDSNETTGPQPNGEDTMPAVGIITQYVKDLSVENPSSPDVYQWPEAPQIDVQFNIGSRDLAADLHEVELKVTVTAKSQAGTAFIVDLAYCGLIGMRNVAADQAHPFLFAEAPRILFPFARRVLADAVRDAGFPPLMLEPIDFNGLYLQQIAAQQQEQGDAGEAPAGNA